MIAVLSATENDFYAYPLPIVVWTWYKLGIKSIVFTPENVGSKIELAKKYCGEMTSFHTFKCEERKEATYAQTSRLFGATVVEDENEILITGDSDLAVFGNQFEQFKDSEVRIIGADLLSDEMNQFPMCFIGMPVYKWKDIFCLRGDTLQMALDDTVGNLESISFRGDFWGYDQWLAYQTITRSGVKIFKNSRAKMPERFAMNRCDRDNIFWEKDLTKQTMDAHLWRPLFEAENFEKLMKLLKFFYPDENYDWLTSYNSEYLKIIE
jgi:hypothetical protein